MICRGLIFSTQPFMKWVTFWESEHSGTISAFCKTHPSMQTKNPLILRPIRTSRVRWPLRRSKMRTAQTTGEKKVPVENGREWGAGSQDGHWRESVFGNEIMSTSGSGHVSEPVSAITIQSLADIGYAVDVSRADSYRLPPPGTARRKDSDDQTHLVDDIIRGPINVIDTDGNVVDIIE